jgi:anti-sigma factor RsiW
MSAPVVCASGVELLNDYLEGVLPAEVRADLEAHLLGCPRCVAFVESYRATGGILRRATATDLPEGLETSLQEFLRAQRRR